MDIWDKLYEKMYGGFENLGDTCKADDDESDELEAIPKSKKTSSGYLKDGFIVDSDNEDDAEYSDDDSEEEENVEEDNNNVEDLLELEDVGSELSEESYTY